MRTIALLVAAAAAFAAAPRSAFASECTWTVDRLIHIDPDPVTADDESAVCEVLAQDWTDPFGVSHDMFDAIPIWRWAYALDADPWLISAELDAYALWWGFSAQADTLGGGAKWRVQRVTICPAPLEDIEVDVRSRFKASAALSGDEHVRLFGRLRYLCSLPSSHHAGAIDCDTQGGVEIDSDSTGSSTTVEAFGISITLASSSSGARSVIPECLDGGGGTGSPYTIDTVTNVGVEFELDGLWNGLGADIEFVNWYVDHWATCDGLCLRVFPVQRMNTYPNP